MPAKIAEYRILRAVAFAANICCRVTARRVCVGSLASRIQPA